LEREPKAHVAIVVYTWSLIDMFKTGMEELHLSVDVPVMTYYEFVDRNTEQFDYIFCDEVQDLPANVLFAMNNRAKKIIVAGDSNQSIYDTDPKWYQPVVEPDDVGNIINARAFSLNIIHRLTHSIINAGQRLLPDMNIWGAKRDLTKQDVNIRLCEAMHEPDEVKYVYMESQKGTAVGDTSVILLPTHSSIEKFAQDLLKQYNKNLWSFKPNKWDENKPRERQRPDYDDLNNHMKQQGLKIQYIGNNQGSLKEAENNKDVILMTYHSSKGLDFDNVFLPYLNANFYLHPSKAATLFMVAMTRSRKNLYISYFGYTHDFVDYFKGECTEINISDILNGKLHPIPGNNFDF
jgi:superfamily I DNA/RNA helicase